MLFSLAVLGALVVAPRTATPADTAPSAAALLRPPATVSSIVPAPVRGLPALGLRSPGPFSTGRAPGVRPVRPEPGSPQVVEYSDAYFTRLEIHKWASFLTLPLFAAQYAVGQKLINGNGSDRLKGVHGLLAGSIAGLFAVNTVTGGLNAIEAWKDPVGRKRRTLHTVLMLVADVGFVVTAATAQENESEGGVRRRGNNNTHRAIALGSMGTALIGIAVMLPMFGR